ncbi:hypothetical protein D187_004311 [Cystobacter fuscus DSM 2262]|uniref:Peptidase C58 YopT-type domain-containing protein n=1 Tax=Cystobacter fuscus (strain ATCC 25194 / DSM 2262 / NBRC 100088 / M29) TaxID=1242864 RepID=S9P729_CYSF2|nr:YopT-type cysteine protease domain-containing protein [Cystobacter fuscus]EPX58022.1 hypothetical protein D187_004311 [Cystobacter fuscus DSM 2262]
MNMKIKNGSPAPPPSSVRGHERVRQGPAPLATPRQEGPRRESPTPSPAPEKSRYDTTQQRGGPAVPSKAPTPQEHAAYTTRTSSLRYGQRSAAYHAPDSAPPQGGYDLNESFASMNVGGGQPGWQVLSAKQTHIDSVLLDHTQRPISGANLTQYIAQDENPEFNRIPGSGACSAITTNWFKAGMRTQDPEQASANFNHRLGDSHRLATQQKEYLHKYQKVGQLLDARGTAVQNKADAEQELHERKADFEEFAQEARDTALHPEDRRKYRQLEAEKRTVPRDSKRYQDIVREQGDLTSHAIRLALSDAESMQRFQQSQTEFANVKQDVMHFHGAIEALDQDITNAIAAVERHENAGLRKVWSREYDMRSSSVFGDKVTEKTNEPGFYRISLKGDRRGHAMGIENLGNGQFKFMDPNSGEFHLHDKAALRHVVTQNARLMGYANDAFSFEIQHLLP